MHEPAVLLPIGLVGQPARRPLVRADDDVRDVVLLDQLGRARIATQHDGDVRLLLAPVRQAVAPDPPRIADHDPATRQAGDRLVVIGSREEDGFGVGLRPRPGRCLHPVRVGEGETRLQHVRIPGGIQGPRQDQEKEQAGRKERRKRPALEEPSQERPDQQRPEQRPEDEELLVVPVPGVEEDQVGDQEP